MTTEERVAEAQLFACAVLGLDGVTDAQPPAGSVLAAVNELRARFLAEGRSDEEFAAAAEILAARRYAEQVAAPSL